METSRDENENQLTARDYQTNLVEKALNCNSIIYLPTGAGKTFIAIQVIKRMSNSVVGEWGQGAKRTAFLCNSVALAQQQCEVLTNSTNLKVKLYIGQMNVDHWKRADWETEFRENQVLVCTTQVLLDCIRQKYISLKDFNLLIFDECHHATRNHTMHQLMQQFQHENNQSALPRVIGLTGVLIKSSKESQILIDLNNLEAVFRAKIITVADMNEFKNVLIYSTKPKEFIVGWKDVASIPSPLYNRVKSVVKGVIETLNNYPVDVTHCRMSKNLGSTRAPSPIKNIQNILEDFLYHLKELGAYSGTISLLFVLTELEYKKKSGETDIYRKMVRKTITICEYLRSLLMASVFDDDESRTEQDLREAIINNSTSKLSTFLNYLRNEFKDKNYKDVKCLIFVQRRYTAKILNFVIKDYIGNNLNFIPLKTEFMVGKNKVMPESIDDLVDNDKLDRDIMANFRRSTINCIVCSSVLEEGIDVQECNYVIMFDELKTFSTYVQTKGRARMQNSFYVVLTSESSRPELIQKIQVFQNMDKLLKHYLIDRTIDRTKPSALETARQFQVQIEPYLSKIGARLEADNVVPLLYRYFMCLPNDSFTTSQSIRWTAIPVEKGCQVSLQLPLQSTVKDNIISDIMPNMISAKRSAAMKACIKLYENKELTDHLVPFSTKKVLEELDDSYFPHWKRFPNESAKIAGTKKKCRTYERYFPKELCSALPVPNQISHLYEIVMKHHFEASEVNQHLIKAFESECRFGILSCKLLPAVADFPLYMHQGKLTVSIKYIRSEIFIESSQHLRNLQNFHVMIFRDILNLFKYFMSCDNSNEENSFLLVPLESSGNIGWEIVGSFQNLSSIFEPSLKQKKDKKYVSTEWLNKVVIPRYSNKDVKYMVVKVHENMSPLTPFPKSTYSSYEDYVEKVYQQTVERTDTFMIEVKAITESFKFFSPGLGQGGAKKKMSENFIIILIPELCHNYEFPSDLWVKCKLLPSILHRLNSILVAEKLRTALNDFVGVANNFYKPSSIQEHHVDADYDQINESFDRILHIKNDTHLEDLAKDKSPEPVEQSISLLDSIASTNKCYIRPIDISRNIDSAYIVDFEYAIAYINQQLPEQLRRMNLDRVEAVAGLDAELTMPKAICDIPRKDIRILKINNPKTPEQFDLLQAITAAGATDNFNMERVEVLGDAFLKFSVSLYLMHKFPNWNEGNLSSMKGKLVSNQNLLYLASLMDFNLPGMIVSNQFDPTTEWSPPLISSPKNLIKMIKDENLVPRTLYDLCLTDDEIKSGVCSDETLGKLLQTAQPNNDTNTADGHYFINKQIVSDKVVADCVEAILGTTLQNYGINKNFEVLQFFGIIDRNEENPSMVLKEKLINPKIKANISIREVDQFLVNYDVLERKLNYKFQDRSYLLSALTHPSYPTNRFTGCYQQLEFLGDAILDFLITCYIVEQNPEMNPGRLTDLRMALVNNVTLSCICVRNQFHKHLLYENAALLQSINHFEKFQRDQNFDISSEVRLLRNEDESAPAMGDYVDVPKALGDVVESLIGAVFLDTHNDLEKTWHVIYELFKNEIHKFTANVPIQVVRQLYEFNGANPKFNDAVEKDGTYLVNVTFTCHDQRKVAAGFGKNSKQAQQSAAKSALVYLQQNC
ncbi:Dcr-2 family protein [Megaselia abdita]